MVPLEGNEGRGLITVRRQTSMLEMVQTKSAASSVTDHRGNVAVAGGGESASVISQHNNHR